jgi:hypothetical protein
MKSYLQSKKWVSKVFCMIVLCSVIGSQAYAQSTTVSGTITDTGGMLMPGVSIFEKGTTNGTTTDTDGKYSLSVGSNAVLVFSFIGMKTQEIPVGAQAIVDIVMDADISLLDEVVVIGYGTMKKSDSDRFGCFRSG